MIDTTMQVGHDLPFTVEPPSVKQMRLWAKFGEQAANANDMWVLRDAYSGFAWYCRALENATYIRSLLAEGHVPYVSWWLGSFAQNLSYAFQQWMNVVARFQEHYGDDVKRWANEAARQVEVVQQLLEQVCQYTLVFCGHYGFEMSESSHDIIASMFPQWTQQQTSSPFQQ